MTTFTLAGSARQAACQGRAWSGGVELEAEAAGLPRLNVGTGRVLVPGTATPSRR